VALTQNQTTLHEGIYTQQATAIVQLEDVATTFNRDIVAMYNQRSGKCKPENGQIPIGCDMPSETTFEEEWDVFDADRVNVADAQIRELARSREFRVECAE